MKRLSVPDQTFARLGLKPRPVQADGRTLQKKHPEYFQTPEEALAHVVFVLESPDWWSEASSPGRELILRRDDVQPHPGKPLRAVVVHLEARGGSYLVRTAYCMDEAQATIKKQKAQPSGVPEPIPVRSKDASQGGGAPSGRASDARPIRRVGSRGKKINPPSTSNPPPAFGTRERVRNYGLHEGGYASGARADRKKSTRARNRRALTKKGREEQAELQAQDPEMRVKLKEDAKANRAFGAALKRVLGPEGRVHAVKLAPASGTFQAADVAAFLRDGWTVLPAASLPAKVGTVLGAVEPLALNPGEPVSGQVLARILGPKGEARALVLAHSEPVFDRAMVEGFRAAGFDVSPAPKGLREGLKVNPAKFPGHRVSAADTREHERRQASPMAKKTVKTPRKATAQAKPVKAKAQAKPVKATAQAKPAKAKAKPKSPKTKAPALRVEKVVTTAVAVNPSSSALAKAWKAWTGADPGQVLMVKVPAATVATPAGTVRLPSEVVFLGRLSKLYTRDAKEKNFGGSGPYMVSDAELEHLWLIDPKTRAAFDLKNVAIITYLARKPKFGDRGVVEYIHAFDRPARAAIAGHVGIVKGSFRLTPRGIEG